MTVERNGSRKGVDTLSTEIFTHMHILIKDYDLFSPWDPVFGSSTYEKQVCLQLLLYPELLISLSRGRKKRRQHFALVRNPKK
jgi:hypothetical protein